MTLATSMDDLQLITFLHRELGRVADVLGLSPGGETDGRAHYDEAVNDTLLAYGQGGTPATTTTGLAVTTAADATDLRRLRSLGRRSAWRLAHRQAAALYNFSLDNQRLERKDVQAMIAAALAQAESEVDALDYDETRASNRVRNRPAWHTDDPYRNRPWTIAGAALDEWVGP